MTLRWLARPLAVASFVFVLGCSQRSPEDLPVVYDLAERLAHATTTGEPYEKAADGWSQAAGSRISWRLVVPRRGAFRVAASFAEGSRAEAVLVAGDERIPLFSLDRSASELAVSLDRHGGKRAALELTAEGTGSVRWQETVVTGSVEPRDVNLVVFTIDSLRADHVSAYGYDRPTTPNIDALAARGTSFLDAFSSSNQSGPAHTSLFTGRYPQSHGMFTNHHTIDPQQRTLAHYLARSGFRTSAHVNFSILGDRTRAASGFEHSRVVPGTPSAVSLEGRRRNIYGYAHVWLERTWQERFFLWVHSQFLHMEHVPEPYATKFLRPDWKPGADGIRMSELHHQDMRAVFRRISAGELTLSPEGMESVIATYDGAVRMTDEYVGLVVRELARLGLDPFTAIVVTSDHGVTLGEFGRVTHLGRPYDHQLHVPLVIFLPGTKAKPGQKIRGLVELIDVAPTILSYFDMDVPRRMQGSDLLPAIRGGPFTGKPAVYAWIGATPDSWQSIRDHRWRYNVRRDQLGEWIDVSRPGREDARVSSAAPPDATTLLAALDRWVRETPIAGGSATSLPPKMREALEKAGYMEANP